MQWMTNRMFKNGDWKIQIIKIIRDWHIIQKWIFYNQNQFLLFMKKRISKIHMDQLKGGINKVQKKSSETKHFPILFTIWDQISFTKERLENTSKKSDARKFILKVYYIL